MRTSSANTFRQKTSHQSVSQSVREKTDRFVGMRLLLGKKKLLLLFSCFQRREISGPFWERSYLIYCPHMAELGYFGSETCTARPLPAASDCSPASFWLFLWRKQQPLRVCAVVVGLVKLSRCLGREGQLACTSSVAVVCFCRRSRAVVRVDGASFFL